jgi:hypothetical protein
MRYEGFYKSRKNGLVCRNVLGPIVDNPALPVSCNLPEDGFHPHPDPGLFWAADDLNGRPRPLIQGHDGKHIGGHLFELLTSSPNDGIRNNGSGPCELIINDIACSPAIGTERSRREETPATGGAPGADKVVALGNFSPETCNRHRQTPRICTATEPPVPPTLWVIPISAPSI